MRRLCSLVRVSTTFARAHGYLSSPPQTLPLLTHAFGAYPAGMQPAAAHHLLKTVLPGRTVFGERSRVSNLEDKYGPARLKVSKHVVNAPISYRARDLQHGFGQE